MEPLTISALFLSSVLFLAAESKACFADRLLLPLPFITYYELMPISIAVFYLFYQ
jgi:hypothetical protein